MSLLAVGYLELAASESRDIPKKRMLTGVAGTSVKCSKLIQAIAESALLLDRALEALQQVDAGAAGTETVPTKGP